MNDDNRVRWMKLCRHEVLQNLMPTHFGYFDKPRNAIPSQNNTLTKQNDNNFPKAMSQQSITTIQFAAALRNLKTAQESLASLGVSEVQELHDEKNRLQGEISALQEKKKSLQEEIVLLAEEKNGRTLSIGSQVSAVTDHATTTSTRVDNDVDSVQEDDESLAAVENMVLLDNISLVSKQSFGSTTTSRTTTTSHRRRRVSKYFVHSPKKWRRMIRTHRLQSILLD